MEPDQKNYFKNTKDSHDRTIRIEVIGEVNEQEIAFLDATAYFLTGTLSKRDPEHIRFVSDQMTKLIKFLVSYVKKKHGLKED